MGDGSCLFKATTRYNSISIETDDKYWTLRTANSDVQSRIRRTFPAQLALKNLEYLTGVLLFMPPPKTICVLGTGAGGLIHFFKHHYPGSHITAIEIDGEMLQIMQQRVALPAEDQQLTYVIDDASNFLDNCKQQFDLILVDLFLGNLQPQWLLQKHSMQQIYSRLNKHGGVGYNLLIDSEQNFIRYYRGLRSIFHQQTLCVRVDELDNILAFAFRDTQPPDDMSRNIARATQLSQQLNIDYMKILSTIYSTTPAGAGVI